MNLVATWPEVAASIGSDYILNDSAYFTQLRDFITARVRFLLCAFSHKHFPQTAKYRFLWFFLFTFSVQTKKAYTGLKFNNASKKPKYVSISVVLFSRVLSLWIFSLLSSPKFATFVVTPRFSLPPSTSLPHSQDLGFSIFSNWWFFFRMMTIIDTGKTATALLEYLSGLSKISFLDFELAELKHVCLTSYQSVSLWWTTVPKTYHRWSHWLDAPGHFSCLFPILQSRTPVPFFRFYWLFFQGLWTTVCSLYTAYERPLTISKITWTCSLEWTCNEIFKKC